jgi:hypothetical protein
MKSTTTTTFKAPESKKKRGKGAAAEEGHKSQSENTEKDETLFLFRALGKVLYSKRNA